MSHAIARGALAVLLAGTSLGLAACNSRNEAAAEKTADAMEDQADAIRSSADATADAMEDRAAARDGASESAMETGAAKVRASGEAKADAVENKADAVRDKAD